jgi:hypothetical protein
MFVLAVHRTPSLTRERYEEVVRRVTGGKSHFDAAADVPFDGLLMHAAGESPHGFVVIDVFESEEAVARFQAAMGTMPREIGIEEPPEFFPATTFVSTLGEP